MVNSRGGGHHGARYGNMRDFDPRGSQLVFLISLPRSGSTLLQRILGGHPDIATLAEPWIMLHPLYALKRGGIETEYDAGVARDALDDFLAQIDGGEDAYLEEIRRFAGNLYARALARQGKTRFLDKTPRYYRIIPELQRVFPEAKFVFLLRNPLGVLSSTLHTWFNDDPKRLDGKRNHSDLLEGPALLADGIASLGDAAIVVRYEELVDAPEQVTADLCARLGIDYRPEMIEYGRSPAPPGRFGDQAGVPRHTRPTGTSRDKWVEYLRDDPRRGFALDYLDRLGETTLAALGYAADELRRVFEIPATSPDALIAAGESAFAAGDVQEALRLFKQARESGCADAELLNNLMVAHWHNGDAEQALHCLVVALEADPDHRTSVLNGIQILTALGQADEARGLGRRYVARHPDDLEIAEACGITLETSAAGAEPVTPPQPPAPARNLSDAVDLVDFSAGSAASARAPKITVVIPSFNQGKYLEQTLRSVFDQNYPNLEVIVMDGGSTDASVEVIRKYADRIAYWQSERDAGQYWAVDAGFRRSTGEIMTWINSDDKLHRGAFNLIASVFMQLPRVEWITGVPNVMNEDGVLQWVCHPPPVFSRDRYLKKSYDYPSFIQQEGTFWRRSLWEKAGACLRTDLRMAGDLELWTRFFRHAPLHTIDTFTGCFRQQRDQKTAKAMDLYRAEADRILDDEIARVRSSGGQVIAPVEVVRLTHRESELRARRSMVARFVRKMFHQERVRLAPASAVLTSGRCPMPSRSMHGGHNAPLVTAIISTYNSERFIRGCIEDLEAQTLADQLEIIVVDSGSEQNEGVIVGELQQRYGNLKYLRTEERETIYSAWNRGVRAARGKYLTNANTDDRHRPDAFERMVGKLEEHPEVALVYADSAVTHMENAGFGAAAVDAYFRWPDFDARNLFAVCYVGPQPMWRAALHERYGYFDPSLRVAGDYEFWLRLAPHETFLHLPETLGLYLSSPGSIEHAHAGIGAQESELARERHWPQDWGQRPPLGKGYLVPAQDDTQGTSTLPGTGPSGWKGGGPLVSVVIATKDRPQLLGCALQSLVRQTYTRWEALVVNDGGTDVAGVIEAVAGAGRIRYLPLGTSIGQAKARNRALREIRGSIVCFLDDDDLYLPEHLQTIVAALGPPQRDVVYTDADLVLEVVKDGTRQELERWTNPYRHDEFSRTRLYADNYIPINTWGIRTDCLRRAGHFDESMTCCEDWDLLLRLSREFAFTHVAQTTVEVRHRANVVDNVTRLRIDETVAAYRRIFSTYDDFADDPELSLLRERALDGLHDKLLTLSQVTHGKIARIDATKSAAPGTVVPPSELEREARWFALRSKRFSYQLPAFHVLVVGDAGVTEDAFAMTYAALQGQLHTAWTATLVLPEGATVAFPVSDRVHCMHGDAATALADAAQRSDADWFVVLSAGDLPEPMALARAVDYFHSHPEARFVYTDERRHEDGRETHHRKPDFNREYGYAFNYLAGLCLFAREVIADRRPTAVSANGLAYEACLLALESGGSAAIGHLSESLVTRWTDGFTAEDVAEQRALLEAHFERCGIAASAAPGNLPDITLVDYRRQADPRVTIVVYADRDTAHLGMLIQQLFEKTVYPAFTLRIGVHAGLNIPPSTHPSLIFDLLSDGERREDHIARIAQSVDTEYLLLLDPAAIVLQPDWLDRLVGHAQRDGVVAVGARLIGQDSRIVHGGLITGLGAYGVVGIAHEGLAMDAPGYMRRAQCAQNLSAVSSACVLLHRERFLAADGFEPAYSVRLYQDVDFCQRLLAQGGEIVWTPQVALLYLGAGLKSYQGDNSRQVVIDDADRIAARWLGRVARDPAYNRHFERKDCSFADETELVTAWDPELRDVSRVLSFGTGSFGSWQYRVAQPLAALTDAGLVRSINTPFSNTLAALPSTSAIELLQPDVLLMHNTLHDTHIDALQAYRRHNRVTVLFGQDDLMFALPPSNPFAKTIYKDIKKRLRKCLDLADAAIVTTEPLAEALRPMIADVRIVPNRLPRSVWGGLRSLRRQGAKPRVGWAGASQHGGDLAMIADVVRQTANEVDWVFFGMCPEAIRPYVKEFHRGVPFADYPAWLASLNLDLAVAPLERNRFNEAKSNLRILEYGVLGWPVIASDIHPYREGPIFRVANNPSAWIRAIREHLADPDALARAGDQLQAWVQSHWMLEDHLDQWLAVLQANSVGEPAAPARRTARRTGV